MSDKVAKGGGEGNRPAARRYNKQTEEFTHSKKGKESIRKAGQLSEEEAREAEEAEREGKKRAMEKDPEVARDYDKPTRQTVYTEPGPAGPVHQFLNTRRFSCMHGYRN